MGKGPSLKPKRINEDVWFYENPKSLKFVVWVTCDDGSRVCKTFDVRWSKLAKTFPAQNQHTGGRD